MNRHDDLDILGLDDPMKRKEASRHMTSAKDVAAFYDYQEKQRAALAAQARMKTESELEKVRLEEMRTFSIERASKERERVELLRYRENRKLSLIAIWVAVVSTIISAIAIFK
ncbi:MAG: hypothetical protein JSU04_20385 [Bdellovibrionales bacterium]|nr:hypothetical protein [Bdellovibrionales bacterium]